MFEIFLSNLFVMNVKGLWDNLFDDEVAALCGIALSPLESLWLTGSVFMSTAPRDVAKGLALAAYWKSIQLTCETTFTQSVRDIGGINYGGKPDDITVCIFIMIIVLIIIIVIIIIMIIIMINIIIIMMIIIIIIMMIIMISR